MKAPYATGCTQMCNQGRDCTCVTHQCQSAAPEGGNVWFSEPEEVPLTTLESVLIYTSITIGSIAIIAILAWATGWIYQTFFI